MVQRSTRSAFRSIPSCWRRAVSASTRSRRRWKPATSICPPNSLWGASAIHGSGAGQLTNAAAYRPLIITYRNGSPVRLADVGRVIDSVENDKTAGWTDGVPSVVLAIQRQPGVNTVEVVDKVLNLLPSFQAEMPAGLTIRKTGRTAPPPFAPSVNDVQFTLVLTVFLVVMVIFLFLRNLSATVIPSLALPMSILGTFAVMWVLNYTLDNMSLMAITLAVGFVVDDAIVMLENIVRHMENGQGRAGSLARGSRGDRLHHHVR